MNYGAGQGIPWVILTNGVNWEIYRIGFDKPITHEQVCQYDFLELSARKKKDHEILYLLCKEGLSKAVIDAFHEHVQAVNRFVVVAVIRSEPVLAVVRRELRRPAPDARATSEEISELLPEVLKRDVIEGEAAVQAHRRVQRAITKAQRKRCTIPAKHTVGVQDQRTSGEGPEEVS